MTFEWIREQTSDHLGWAKGYTGTVSKLPREGYTEVTLTDLGFGNPNGTYFVHEEFLRIILDAENLKLKLNPGGIFYSHDEL